MDTKSISQAINRANRDDINVHLVKCNNDFVIPLSERVNIEEYSALLESNSVTFEAWHANELIGLIAVYYNEHILSQAFITNVSIIKKHSGFGIASTLLKKCIEYSKKNNVRQMKLDVHKNSHAAIQLYIKHKFEIHERNNDEVTMILYFDE